MAKRFVDTEIWNKLWYQELSLKEKVLVRYIFEQCDCAGVWDINFRLASFIIGESVSFEDIETINEKNFLFEIFDNDKIFVVDFIKFQYGTLSENCKPHKPIIEKLKKYNLFERVLKGYSKGIDTLEEKEKEKEQEKEKDKEKDKVINNPDNIFNPIVKEFHKQMKDILHNAIRLSIEQSNKVVELSQRIPDFDKTIPIVLDRMKNISWNFNGHIDNPDVNWLLKDENYISVLNGRYTTKQQIIAEKLRKKEAENGR